MTTLAEKIAAGEDPLAAPANAAPPEAPPSVAVATPGEDNRTLAEKIAAGENPLSAKNTAGPVDLDKQFAGSVRIADEKGRPVREIHGASGRWDTGGATGHYEEMSKSEKHWADVSAHGSLIDNALLPATDYWEGYGEILNKQLHDASAGFAQLWSGETVGSKAMGALEGVGGAVGSILSPVEAAIDEVAGHPIEIATGISHQATTDTVMTVAPFAGEAKVAKEGIKIVREGLSGVKDTPFVQSFRAVVDPAHMDVPAVKATERIRAANGAFYQQLEIAQKKMDVFSGLFAKMDKDGSYAFMHAMDTGAPQATPELTEAATSMKELLDSATHDVNALGPEHVRNWLENYFPHIWKDPTGTKDKLLQMLSRKTVTGTKAFLKQRKLPTFADGLAAGLEPVSDNPIEMAMLKYGEMQRFVTGTKLVSQLKQDGLIRFVPSNKMGRVAAGYARLEDSAFHVYRPITAEYREAYDKVFRERILGLAEKLGMTHDRALHIKDTSIGKSHGPLKSNVWGVAVMKDGNMSTQFAGPDFVIAHEFGHLIDGRYGIANTMRTSPTAWEELGQLAMKRSPGAVGEYQDYLLNANERIANLVHAYLYAPELLESTAPHAKGLLEKIIQEHPELHEMEQIRPGVELGSDEITKFMGITKAGEYVAPTNAARVLNNNFGAVSALRKAQPVAWVRNAANTMNMLQLGASAFHFTFVTLDSVNSEVARSLENLSRGNMGAALKGFAVSATGIGPAIRNVIKGSALRSAYLNPSGTTPELQKLVEGFKAAGGRFGYDSMYRASAAGSFIKSARNGYLWKDIQKTVTNNGWKAPFALIARAAETVSAPLMEWYVPRVKAGVFTDLMQDYFRENASARPTEMYAEAQKIWDSVDNRMGLMNYDNLMWNQTLKIAAHLTFRSVGWNLGTIREVGGGGMDAAREISSFFAGNNPKLTHRMAYTAAMVANTAIIGSILTYAYTGKPPQDAFDAFHPPTGKGNERITIPTYMKDLDEYNNAPLETVAGKVNPLWSSISEMLQNKDFYGAAITDPDDPVHKQVTDEMQYLVSQFTPFSLRTEQAKRRALQVPGGRALQFFGIQKAPMSISDPEGVAAIEKKRNKQALAKKHRKEYSGKGSTQDQP